MNYKKVLSFFLVVVSLFVTVVVNSGLMCFAGRDYAETAQIEYNRQEMKRLSKLLKKLEAEREKQKSPSLWSNIKFMFKSHFASIVGITGSMALGAAIICGIFGAVTSYNCYVDRGSFTCSSWDEFSKKFNDILGPWKSSIWETAQFITKNIHTVIVPSQH